MRYQLSRWLLVAGFASTALLGTVDTATAQPVVRDHRRAPPQDSGPREAPQRSAPSSMRPRAPASSGSRATGTGAAAAGDGSPAAGSASARRSAGATRAGRRAAASGSASTATGSTTTGPWSSPARRRRRPDARGADRPQEGFVWVKGHWDWQNGQYVWVAGRYESVRSGKRWRDVRWEQRGNEWVGSTATGRRPRSTRPPSPAAARGARRGAPRLHLGARPLGVA